MFLDRAAGWFHALEAKADARITTWRLPARVFALLVVARLTAGYTWFWGARTKHPWLDPPYGWLESWLRVEIEHNPIPGYPWLVEHVFLPNLDVLGWSSFLVESYLATVLLIGLATRLHGVLAALWGLNISIGNLGAPREPLWSLAPMVLLPLLAAAFAAGRLWGLDGRLRAAWLDDASAAKRWVARWCM